MNCANCGSGDEVVSVTPDLDIRPVPICMLCRFLLWADPDEFERVGRRKAKGGSNESAKT